MRHDIINVQNYALYLDHDLGHLGRYLETKSYTSYVVITDENTVKYCYPKIKPLFISEPLVITISSGEVYKNLDSCKLIWEEMIKANVDRKALVILLGGGVIGDMGGFAASCFKRGMDFIHVPTTLMSMTDSSIGGKLGIDHQFLKNIVGLFKNPKSIFVHLDFLKTLPDEEIRSGFAEVIKHALISDQRLFESLNRLDNHQRPEINYEILYKSIMVKKALVERDPLESIVRKALNFGHTIGHALESIKLKTGNPLSHGESVIFGMLAESFISLKSGLILKDHYEAICALLVKYCNPDKVKEISKQDIHTYMLNDKKTESGTILFSLLNGIGSYSINKPVNRDVIDDALNALMAF